MTINKLASAIAKREGKKSQVAIGNVREILGILADIISEKGGAEVLTALCVYAEKRGKKKKN